MADNKDPFRQLKDLCLKASWRTFSGEQRVRCSLDFHREGVYWALRGFLTGYIIAKLRSSAIMGMLVGNCTGIVVAQSYNMRKVEQTIKGYYNSFRKNK